MWENIIICAWAGGDFLFISKTERKVLTGPVWRTGSVGRGSMLPVIPYGAVPGFIGPFTNTQRKKKNWAKKSCIEQTGFSGTFSLALLLQAWPIKHRSMFLKQGFNITSDTLSVPVCFWRILPQSSISCPTRQGEPGYGYINSFYPAAASKAATHAVCVSPSCQLTGPVTRLSHISCCRPTCFK